MLVNITKRRSIVLLHKRQFRACFLTRAVSRLILLFFFLCATITASFAADVAAYPLQSNRWEQLVVPANSDELSIRDLFANALPAADYSSSWIVFRYDAATNLYVDPGIDGRLTQGTGFWIVQLTDATVSLNLPPTATQASTIADPACNSARCTRVPLVARVGESTFNMVGSAQSSIVSIGQTKLRTDAAGSLCENGCTWDEAITQSYVSAPLWHYESNTNSYTDLAQLGQISPWQAVWLRTEPALAGNQAALLFPAATDDGNDAQDAAAARLLAQASFGASMSDINAVRQLGIEGWIDNQFTLQGQSQYDYVQTYYPSNYQEQVSRPRHHKWLIEAIDGNDQLRQRIAFAYSQILVTSDVPESLRISQSAMANYYDLLSEYAFANYRDLLEAVTLSPTMGTYLSMLQSAKGDPASNTRADENFAREIMQLFSIGLYELNLNGTPRLTASGNPIPAYTQQNIEEYARVFTGWSYNNADVWGISTTNAYDHSNDKINPMQPFPGYHDEGSKTLLRGVVAPAGITPEQDLDIALDSLFNHPNVGPFITKQLIQRLVTSNPSPAYVARIASVFNNNGDGVRGDMRAVIRALLLDTEARDGYQTIANYGKLREPLIRWTHLWRAFNVIRGTDSENNQYNHGNLPIYGPASVLGQAVLSSPSVFNFYHPDYAPSGAIRNADLLAPEAEIYTEATFQPNIEKISWYVQYYYQGDGSNHATHSSNIDISEEIQLAVSSDALLDRLNLLLLSGQMSQELRLALHDHFELLPADLDGRSARVRDAINLIMSSPEYYVQR